MHNEFPVAGGFRQNLALQKEILYSREDWAGWTWSPLQHEESYVLFLMKWSSVYFYPERLGVHFYFILFQILPNHAYRVLCWAVEVCDDVCKNLSKRGENHWVFHTAKQVKFERLTLILSFQPGFMLKYHFHEMPVPEDTTAGVSSWEFGLWYQAACVWVLALHGARHVTLGRLRTFSEFLLSYLWNRGDNNSVVSPSVAVKPEGANVHVRCLGQNLTRHK